MLINKGASKWKYLIDIWQRGNGEQSRHQAAKLSLRHNCVEVLGKATDAQGRREHKYRQEEDQRRALGKTVRDLGESTS